MGPLDPHGPWCGAPAAPPSRGAWSRGILLILCFLNNTVYIDITVQNLKIIINQSNPASDDHE